MTAPDLRSLVLTLCAAGLGAGLFASIGMPAPFLTGSATAVTLASLCGLRAAIPVALRNACFLALGIGIGAVVTVDVLRTAATWPLSFAVLALTLFLCMFISRAMLERFFGFDRNSALLAATPGHLSFVLALAADQGSDIARITVVQSVRVLFLTLVVPPLVLTGFESGSAIVGSGESMPITIILISGIAAYLVGLLFLRMALPAAFLLAGLLTSSCLHLTGAAEGVLPDWISLPAFLVLGSLIGSRFSGQSRQSLRGALFAGIALTFVAICISAMGAAAVALMLGIDGGTVLIAFAPGGVEAMAAIAVQMGLSPTFVAAHHVARLFILLLLIPLFRMR